MCDCDSSDPPSAFRAIHRKAKKSHRCYECRRFIQPGETYEYASGVWDGSPGSFKTCLRCVALRDAHRAAEEPGCLVTFGSLLQAIGECAREDPHYLTAFRAAWKTKRPLVQGASR